MHQLIIWMTQIVTESLPISSSTHCMIVGRMLTHAGYYFEKLTRVQEDLLYIPSFFVVLFFLFRAYRLYFVGVCTHNRHRNRMLKISFFMMWCAAISILVTLGMYCLYHYYGVFCIHWDYRYGFGLTAIALILSDIGIKKENKNSITKALCIGFAQGCALLPGVSRLGLTYVAGRMCGFLPRRALGYSLCLQMILMGGAIARSLPQLLFSIRLDEGAVIVGASFLSYGALRLVALLSRQQKMRLFAWYLLTLALLL